MFPSENMCDHAMLTSREFTVILKKWNLAMLNDTKTVKRGFLSPVSMGLILVFTQLFYPNFFFEV